MVPLHKVSPRRRDGELTDRTYSLGFLLYLCPTLLHSVHCFCPKLWGRGCDVQMGSLVLCPMEFFGIIIGYFMETSREIKRRMILVWIPD